MGVSFVSREGEVFHAVLCDSQTKNRHSDDDDDTDAIIYDCVGCACAVSARPQLQSAAAAAAAAAAAGCTVPHCYNCISERRKTSSNNPNLHSV
jgi:hypothetical protein